jgi:hypothetical protein
MRRPRGRLDSGGDLCDEAAVILALVAVALLLAVYWFSRQSELFYLSVRSGRVLVVRGRAPGGFLGEVQRIVKHVPRASIRAHKTERGGRLSFSGLDEATERRLRNLFGLYPASQLRHARSIAKPTLGQILGIAWLAWLLDGARRS